LGVVANLKREPRMRNRFFLVGPFLLLPAVIPSTARDLLLNRHGLAPTRFEVSFTAAAHAAPITGRLIVVISKNPQPEPRMLVSPQGPAVFGVDLDHLRPGQSAIVDNGAVGYPMSLAELPAGDYYVQA